MEEEGKPRDRMTTFFALDHHHHHHHNRYLIYLWRVTFVFEKLSLWLPPPRRYSACVKNENLTQLEHL